MMPDQPDQAFRDEWQTRLYVLAHEFSVELVELNETNPWPEQPVLDQVINTLATELWDRCFSVAEIQRAFEEAAADLPRYAAGEEVRE